MTHAETSLHERRNRIEALFAALTDGHVDEAATFFAEDAQLMRLRYADGRVAGGEMTAVGRSAIIGSLIDFVGRRLKVDDATFDADGDRLVVRSDWSFDGFHGERVRWSNLSIYDFAGHLISRVCATSSEESHGV